MDQETTTVHKIMENANPELWIDSPVETFPGGNPPTLAGHSKHPPAPIPKTILFSTRAGHAYASRVLFGKTPAEGGTRKARRARATRLRLAMKAHGREALVRTVAALKVEGNTPSWYVNRRQG